MTTVTKRPDMPAAALQRLNREWGVTIARIELPHTSTLPLVLVHSPGLAYAFDSDNTGLDSPAAAMDMLTAHGLHRLRNPYARAPHAVGWHVELDRPENSDAPRPSRLVGPAPLAPIGPLGRDPLPPYWHRLAAISDWWCQVLFISGVDFATLFDYERPKEIAKAARDNRVAGAMVRVTR